MNNPKGLTSLQMVNYFGMSESKARETEKNAQISKYLLEEITEYQTLGGILPPPRKMANLLYAVGSKMKVNTEKYIPLMVEYIMEEKIDTEQRVTAALKYLLEHLREPKLDKASFERACGVGIHVTEDEMEAAVKVGVEKFKADIIKNRYRVNIGLILGFIRTLPNMVWTDGLKLKLEAEKQIIVILGPKTDEDRIPVPDTLRSKSKDGAGSSKKGGGGGGSGATSTASSSGKSSATTQADDTLSPQDRIMNILRKLPFHKPGNNYITEGYPCSDLSMKLLRKHLRETSGQVRTRFPPEPNGILHIGHAKAININFGYARAHNGICFLRYDDTNPEKEEERFFKSILEMVHWLGYSPFKVTHASDYFEELYQFAKVLIQKGLAYVCHQSADEMKGFNPPPSPWRDRIISTNLQLFEDMKAGRLSEGEATLRMKITLEEGKQDPVAYRVRYVPHPRTGSTWCIYPTYDFTHCLCDSLENITHSLCTKEFSNRRSSYYWLCENVETYVPVQWEYGRLNMCYTVVSKRKIAKLITDKIVADWDDPRLFTLPALRRRGFPSEAVNDFCVRMGVTGAMITVEPAMLEACVRDNLNVTAPRTMVVLEPLKVTIENFPFSDDYSIDVPDFPSIPGYTTHQVALRRVVYIEQTDFREATEKGYKRFAIDQPVGLRHAGLILTCKRVVKGENGEITEIEATCSTNHAIKPKGYIHWVSQPMTVEVRLYDRLFNHKNPEDPSEVPGGFLSDCNRDSFHKKEGYADAYFKGADPYTQFQFERIGFFSVDPDTTDALMVFNRTVTLKEDNEKN